LPVEIAAYFALDEIAGKGGEFGSTWYGPPLFGVAAALLGAFATVVLEALVRRRAALKRYNALVRNLRVEVQIAIQEAQTRSQSGQTLPLGAPLPTSAWYTFRAAEVAAFLPNERTSALIQFYRRIEEANALSRVSLSLLSVAALSRDDALTSRSFREEAIRLSSEPYDGIAELGQSVLEVLREASTGIWATINLTGVSDV
jgi:hypothetical protein